MVMALKLAVSVALLAWLFSRVDVATLWATARRASPAWMAVAFAIYALNVLLSIWRWWLLVDAQELDVPFRQLSASMLVALFFNNFLPSNIGGDVIRIGDTAKAAGSKTLATTIVLVDRTMGMMGLVLVAACGASHGGVGPGPRPTADLAVVVVGGIPRGHGCRRPDVLVAGRRRAPAAAAHDRPSRMGRRAGSTT